MANFDTIANGSAIQHADDGKRMIVEWREVTLRDNRAGLLISRLSHLSPLIALLQPAPSPSKCTFGTMGTSLLCTNRYDPTQSSGLRDDQ